MKTKIRYVLAIVCSLSASTAAQASCYADYKAKRDNPLRLHYGVVELNDADCQSMSLAKRAIAERLSQDGWKLLNVLEIFGERGLNKRKDGAGEYFLRY